MITFNEFQTRLIANPTKQGIRYCAPAQHLISVYDTLIASLTEAAHDSNLLDIAPIGRFVRKDEVQDWRLFKLVEV